MTSIVTALLSGIASFVGAWLAARFALDRFYSEKIWERRAAAYTAIFEALHEQAKQLMSLRDIGSAKERDKLYAQLRAAEDALKRRVFSETWLLSDAFMNRFYKLSDEMEVRAESWSDNLEDGLCSFRAAHNDLRAIARKELKIPHDIS